MNLDLLKQIVKVAKDEGILELKVDTSNFKVEIRFSNGLAAPSQMPSYQAPLPSPVSTPAVTAKPVIDTSLHIIKSPFVGTFYSAPSPGKPVYVKLGDRVKVGQALCVLEAMKIMNEIDSDMAGEVVEILVENESLVEFGQPLFKIKPN